MKIVTTCPKEYPGVSRVFLDGEALNLWKHIPTEDISLPIDADLVILGANAPAYHVLLDKIPQPKWLLWTSPLLQTELARVEMEALLYFVREPRISRIWMGERVAAPLLKKAFYAPYPVDVNRVVPTGTHEKSGIGFMVPFGNPQKNVFNQLAAVKIFQETHDVLLKTGGMSPEQQRFADAIGVKYQDLGWRTGQEYYDDLHMCKMSIHASLSESFGYGVLDSMLLDTPCLVSPAVSWMPRNLGLICPDPSNPEVLANSISNLYATEQDVRVIALEIARNRNNTLKSAWEGWREFL